MKLIYDDGVTTTEIDLEVVDLRIDAPSFGKSFKLKVKDGVLQIKNDSVEMNAKLSSSTTVREM